MGRNFKSIPSGQWLSEMTAYRNDVEMGPPSTSAGCTSPLDPSKANALMKMANAGVPNCTSKVVADQERLFEYEQTCRMGGMQQVTHTAMRLVDDRTVTVDTRTNFAGRDEMTAKIKSTYQGACPAGAKAPGNAKSAECAEMVANRASLDEMTGRCSRTAGPDRADCVAQLEGAKRATAMMEQMCK